MNFPLIPDKAPLGEVVIDKTNIYLSLFSPTISPKPLLVKFTTSCLISDGAVARWTRWQVPMTRELCRWKVCSGCTQFTSIVPVCPVSSGFVVGFTAPVLWCPVRDQWAARTLNPAYGLQWVSSAQTPHSRGPKPTALSKVKFLIACLPFTQSLAFHAMFCWFCALGARI